MQYPELGSITDAAAQTLLRADVVVFRDRLHARHGASGTARETACYVWKKLQRLKDECRVIHRKFKNYIFGKNVEFFQKLKSN